MERDSVSAMSEPELHHLAAENKRLQKINRALMNQVERSYNRQGSAFSLFQTAIELEAQIKQRTVELTNTLHSLENSNLALKHAKDAAEQANLSKTRFLAAASHDVLQPLSAAQLLLSSLMDYDIDPKGLQLTDQIQRSLTNMEELLRTLLDISRLDAGVVEPRIEPIELGLLFDELHGELSPLANQRGLALRVRQTDLRVLSDKTILRRILQNILSNGIQYTEQGGVLLCARHSCGKVRVSVYDTGVGIEKGEFKSVFEEFHRGRHRGRSTTQSAGLGLGLSIVNRMVDTLGHTLSLKSELGRGSTFSLELDRYSGDQHVRSDKTEQRPHPYGQLSTLQILLIENDPVLLTAMSGLLTQWGCTVRAASSLSGIESTVTEFNPDVVIADQQLDNDELGLDAVRTVRSNADRRVPAVIVTAAPSESLANASQAEGIEMMAKPVKPAQLRALLNHLSTTRRARL